MLTLQVSPKDVYQLVNQLDIEDKIKIFQNLKPLVVSDRWDRFLKRIDARLKKISENTDELKAKLRQLEAELRIV